MKQAQANESFDKFFHRFQTEPGFQKSRIEFPLKVVSIDDDNSSSVKYISGTQWKYSNVFTRPGRLIKKKVIDATTIEIQLQQQDTGFEMHFLFKSKQNSWWLYSAKDLSD